MECRAMLSIAYVRPCHLARIYCTCKQHRNQVIVIVVLTQVTAAVVCHDPEAD